MSTNLEESHYFESTYGKIHYRSIPIERIRDQRIKENQPVIFFLHGASKKTQTVNHWNPLQNQINKHCIAIKVDTLGNGLSHFYGREIEETFEIKKASLVELINHLTGRFSNRKIGICGRSLGGALAIEIAVELIQKIELLGLIAPGGLKRLADHLRKWEKHVNILWDVEDPVVPFQSFEYLRELDLAFLKLYTVGQTSETTVHSLPRTEAQTTTPTHVPELVAPQLFKQFLRDLCISD